MQPKQQSEIKASVSEFKLQGEREREEKPTKESEEKPERAREEKTGRKREEKPEQGRRSTERKL